MRTLGDKIAETDKKLKEVEQGLRDIMLTIPNMPDASVPVGKDDTENPEVRKWGEPTHLILNQGPLGSWGRPGILDSNRAAKVSGGRFYYYLGLGARLERAVYNFMLDQTHPKDGYTEVIPPISSIGRP